MYALPATVARNGYSLIAGKKRAHRQETSVSRESHLKDVKDVIRLKVNGKRVFDQLATKNKLLHFS